MKIEIDPSLPLFPGMDGAPEPGAAEMGRTIIDFSTSHPPQLVGAWKTMQVRRTPSYFVRAMLR